MGQSWYEWYNIKQTSNDTVFGIQLKKRVSLIILSDNRTTVLLEYLVIIIIPYKVLTKEREMERFKKNRKAKKQTKDRMESSSQNK